MRSALSVALVALVAIAGIAAGPTAVAGDIAPTNAPSTTDTVPAPASDTAREPDGCAPLASDSPADPETDRLGWENGCWANESLSVTREDGLNETELDAVVSRSMARVEAVRELEFERDVPVAVISRDELRERRGTGDDNESARSTANRLHQNVKWEAMFSVGEDEDAISTFSSTRTETIGGFYNYADDRIVIVSENTTTPKMDEVTLSQELFHALQDQTLRVSYDRSTREELNAGLGIIEGDGNLVDRRYQQRCEAEWDCLLPEDAGGGGNADINWGVYLTQFQPYSDGPKFVRGIQDEGGWEAVNDVYENPPETTEQVIHPEKYPDEGASDISFADTSSEAWTIPDLGDGSVDYATFGEAGLAAMMIRPVYASSGSATPVVGPRDFFNYTAGGQVSEFDPLNYGLEATDGWGNDRLYPYVTDESATTNETGYVWKTVWDSSRDASEFDDAYRQLLDYYGAEAVDDRPNTYRIPDDSEFGDAFYVERNGDTVVIVNAPTVADLGDIREGAGAVEETTTPTVEETATATPSPMPTPTETATQTPTVTVTETPPGQGETPTESPTLTADEGPGFGVLVALLAVVALGLVTRRFDP
jgi:PGF-CTERM protein